MALQGAISCDVDTAASLFKGRGCRRAGGYSYDDLRSGLEAMGRFFERYGVKATLFMVGRDFEPPQNHAAIRAMSAAGHELANHTHTHAQGFRLLPPAGQDAEIAAMEDACVGVTGIRPVGFRSPGWNIGDEALPILKARGYAYDSSVFPTSLMPVMKTAHWWATRGCAPAERTTMGRLTYVTAPALPYRTSATGFGRRGSGGLIELPVTVLPFTRLPFFATLFVSGGPGLFARFYRTLRARRRPIQLQFHLWDFVDAALADLADEVPRDHEGSYVARAIRLPLQRKLELFTLIMDTMAADYAFTTLADWARRVDARQPSPALGAGR